jgi:hypothetical protein
MPVIACFGISAWISDWDDGIHYIYSAGLEEVDRLPGCLLAGWNNEKR